MDRGGCWATVHGVANSWTWLSDRAQHSIQWWTGDYLCWEWAYCYQNVLCALWAFFGDLLYAHTQLATGEIHRGVRKMCLDVHILQTASIDRHRSGWPGERVLCSWRESGKVSRRGVLKLGLACTIVSLLTAPWKGVPQTPVACSGLWTPSCALEIVPKLNFVFSGF